MTTFLEIHESLSAVEVSTVETAVEVRSSGASTIEIQGENSVSVVEVETIELETYQIEPTELELPAPRPSVVEVVQIEGYAFREGVGNGPTVEAIDFSARDSVNRDLVYVAWSSAAEGSENPAAAEWKIARFDSTAPTVTLVYAGGVQTYTHVLDSGALEYEGYSYP